MTCVQAERIRARKVLMVTPAFFPRIGGVERHVLRVGRELRARGHEVAVLTDDGKGSLRPEETVEGLEVRRYDWSSSAASRAWRWRNRRWLRSFEVHHVHDFTAFVRQVAFFPLVAARRETFVTFHGHEGIFPIPRKVLLLRRMTERLTRGNMCVGDFIPRWYGTRADLVTYGGVDPPPRVPDKDPNRLAVVARLEPDTDVDVLFHALALLPPAERAGLRVDVCGDGSLRGRLEVLARESGVDAAFHGFVKDASPYLAAARYAYTPGYLSILEAASHGCVCLAGFSTPLKRDYFRLMPAGRWLLAEGTPAALAARFAQTRAGDVGALMREAEAFARARTWAALAQAYEGLWRKA